MSRPVPTPDPRLFAALSDPTRLALVERLRGRPPQSTSALAGGTELTRQAVTKHLEVLRDADLVRDERVGRERCWSLHAAPLRQLADWSAEVRREWEARFDRLEAFLAAPPTPNEGDDR